MSRGLRIAPRFELPLDLVTEATAIVATRGAGKSSASAVLVEESFALGVQSVIFDRTGVYWGLRSSKLGSRPWSSWDVDGHPCGARLFGITDGKGGAIDEWPADLRIREFPAPVAAIAE